MNKSILIVGAGGMAVEYAKIIKDMGIPFVVVGRSNESAAVFEKTIGNSVVRGGINNWLKAQSKINFQAAIVATDEEELGPTARNLIKQGLKKILIEKPGGIDGNDIKKTARLARSKRAKVFVAYNRRFYSSTTKTALIIKEDGGVLSFNFEFTEWSHTIEKLAKSSRVKKKWFLANSSHVVDLAFFLGGKPQKINCYATGGLNWHPRASIYAGAGVSSMGALFSYFANWESAGRWGVEILTPKRKLILRPLEKLSAQNKGSLVIEEIPLDNELDIKFKPGLYLLLKSFLGSKSGLPDIEEQVENLKYYNLIGKNA